MKFDEEMVIELLDASLAADYARVRRIGSEIARIYAAAGSAEAAKHVRTLIRKRGVPLHASGLTQTLPVDHGSRLPLVEEQAWPTTPFFASETVKEIVTRLLEDAQHVELLSSQGLAPRLCLMLSGAPGTGKSLLAGHIAMQLGRPFYVARLDSLISSRLGETAKNIRGIFDYAPARGAVLLLDEMDTIAKLRDDRQELGELKRVVNTVIQGLDSLPADAVVIGATNHPHLLDPAIWRRFPFKIELGIPEADVRRAMWLHFLYEDSEERTHIAEMLASLSADLSGADIQSLSLAARREGLLANREINIASVVWAVLKSKGGQLRLPVRGELTPEQKKELARSVADLPGVKKLEIADLLGVSRQMVARYLSENPDG